MKTKVTYDKGITVWWTNEPRLDCTLWDFEYNQILNQWSCRERTLWFDCSNRPTGIQV